MWALIRWIVMKLAVVKLLYKLLGGFAFLVPLALLLKFVGLPVLAVLGVLAFPVLILLLLFGLPLFLVLVVGGGILAFLFCLLTLGLVVLKLAIVVGLPLWIAWQLGKWLFGRRDGGNGATPPPATGTEGSGI